MDWIKEKFWHLNDVFEEYPKVYWMTIFYMVLAVIAAIGYFPLLKGIANLTLITVQPFQALIIENFDMLRWGQIAIPLVILIWGMLDAADLYRGKVAKRYRY